MNFSKYANWKTSTALLFKKQAKVTPQSLLIKAYLKLVETLLKDSSKFKNSPVAPYKDLDYVLKKTHFEIDLLKKLNNKKCDQ